MINLQESIGPGWDQTRNPWITSVRFCLSYDLLNVILSPSKFVYFNENLLCCNGHPHDITCSRQKCYVTCGHIIIYDWMTVTSYD